MADHVRNNGHSYIIVRVKPVSCGMGQPAVDVVPHNPLTGREPIMAQLALQTGHQRHCRIAWHGPDQPIRRKQKKAAQAPPSSGRKRPGRQPHRPPDRCAMNNRSVRRSLGASSARRPSRTWGVPPSSGPAARSRRLSLRGNEPSVVAMAASIASPRPVATTGKDVSW
jgi:hypothetical protein